MGGRANENRIIRTDLLRLLVRFKKISVGNPLASLAGDIVRTYGLEVPDAIIAATAITEGLVLLTRNTRHFSVVPGLKIRSPY